MKRYAAAFAAMFILAAGFLLAGSLFMRAARLSADISGEVLAGERPAGLKLRQEISVSGQLHWDLGYDAGTGESSSASEWTTAVRGLGPWYAGENPRLEVYGGLPAIAPDVKEEIPGLSELVEDAQAAGGEEVVELTDYLDAFPLYVNGGPHIYGEDGMELADGYDPRLTLPFTGQQKGLVETFGAYCNLYLYDEESGYHYYADISSDCVFSPAGYIYLVINNYEPGLGHGADMELWRMPVDEIVPYRMAGEPEPGDITQEEGQWWRRHGFGASCSERLESVAQLDGGVLSKSLGLSRDGKYVLLYTEEAGGVYLTCFDAALGEPVQRLLLFPAEALSEHDTSLAEMVHHVAAEGYDIFSITGGYAGDYAAAVVMEYAGGRYEPCERAALTAIELGGGRELLSRASRGFAYDGGRLYTLEHLRFRDSEGRCDEALLLRAFEGGGQVYAELLTGSQMLLVTTTLAGEKLTLSINGVCFEETEAR